MEEGAEEFFLKPVRLSDLNRLRPRIIKTKSKDHNQEKPTNFEEQASQKLEISKDQQEQEEEELLHHQLQLQQPPPPSTNKRKTMEEGLSPDRTRPRYTSGITTVV